MNPRGAASLLFALLLAGGGCAYKVEIKQGSEALLESADALQTGMTQDEVVRLLGPPPVQRLFRKNIWIYAYQEREAGFAGAQRLRSIELVFDDSNILRQINPLHDDYAQQDS